MKKVLFALCAILWSTVVLAQVQARSNGFVVTVKGVVVKVEFYTPNIVRVSKTLESGNVNLRKSLAVVLEPTQVEVNVSRQNDMVKASSSLLEVILDLNTGRVQFSNLDGSKLLTEKDYGVQLMPLQYVQRIREKKVESHVAGEVVPTQSAPGQNTPGLDRGKMRTIVENTYEVSQSFILDEDEVIYGLGQQQTGKMNQRNQRLVLEQNNMQIAVPYFASVKGYGLYWDNYSITTFDDTPMGTSFRSEAGEAIDYYFLYGGNGDATVALLRQLSGQAPMVPLWTLGFWQCKERYKSQDEVVEVAEKYRKLGVPLDGIIQDWRYWGEDNSSWNAIQFLNPNFSRPQEMFSSLRKMNVKMMISVWPSFGNGTEIFKELDKKGALYPMVSSPREARVYDAFNPEARGIVWDYMNRYMFQLGMSAWWMDATEPEFYGAKQSDFNFQTKEGALRNVRNIYPLYTSKAIWDNQRATTLDKRVYILTRSAYIGSQRYGAGSWSGDIRASFDVFKKQIPAGLNFSICGIPYWNTDIGAWHPYGNVYNTAHKDPAYQQLYVRWFQFATFNPMMRSHGTGSPREIYQFGERGYWAFDVQEQYIKLRYSLLPYLYSTAWQVTKNGYSYLRQLSMEAPHDTSTYQISDEFMFGSAFLVAPVVEEDAVSRSVYLPDNTKWIDFWTGQILDGGQVVERATPIEIIPVYVKAGSIVPFTINEVQYATERKWDKLELRIYPGDNGEFVLYEDENDNYNYESGAYSEIPITWDNEKRILTIGDRKGRFAGMVKNRKFIVNIAGSSSSKTVCYNGRELRIEF